MYQDKVTTEPLLAVNWKKSGLLALKMEDNMLTCTRLPLPELIPSRSLNTLLALFIALICYSLVAKIYASHTTR